MLIVALLALAAVVMPLQVLTGIGARRRGQTVTWAALAGLFFWVTWIVWYVVDEHPYPRSRRRPA